MLSRTLLLRLADSPRVERMVKRNGMSAPFVRRFVAGETMEQTVEPVRAINARGMTATLDYLGENVTHSEEAEAFVEYYHRLLRFIDENCLNSNISLKLTQLGMDIGQEFAAANLISILNEAEHFKQFIRLDMEGSTYTDRTLKLFDQVWANHKNVGVVIQSYLRRSPTDIHNLVATGARVRLVKGAYKEPKEVAFQDKVEVNSRFVEEMKVLLAHGNYPAIATHDQQMLKATKEFADKEGIGADRYEFQMLYGIRRDLQESLVKEGHRMRVYVPFGSQWYGYMMRRLAERPANLWFVLKNILRR